MSFDSKKIIGTCFSMCSEKERCLREREGLLSILEIDEKTKNQKHKKADPAKTVKCFQRSSAGKSFADDPSELRPGPVLMLTVRYLLNKVSLRKDVDWSLIYEFTFDRIRAIRQDMIIQRLDAITSIKILEPIVKFHIYAAERMRERPLKDYVPKFNDQHLLECIKQLLVLYDEVNYASADVHEEKKPTEFEKNEQFSNRCTIEAVYLLLYLGDPSALSRGLSLPSTYRNSPVVQQALEISLGWYLKNYVRVCRKVSQLPSLLAMAVLNNIRSIRSDALEIMSAGYQSKILTFPGDKLREILLYNDMKKVSADCKLLGIDFVDNNLHFKHRLNTDLLANPEKTFSDTQLDKLLPYIFF